MEKTLLTQLIQAEGYLQNKKIAEAKSEILKIEYSSLNEEEKALHCLLDSEIKLWSSDYDINKSIKKAISYYRTSTDNIRYAKAKYLYGWLLAASGDLFNAREVLLEAYLTYKRYDLAPEMARALNRLAAVQYSYGDFDDAINSLSICIDLYSGLKQSEKVLAFKRNIGTVLLKCGKIRDAICQYEKIRDSVTYENLPHQLQYFLSYSLSYALKGKIKKALGLIGSCDYTDEYKREQAIYYEYLGWIYNLDGQFKKAEKTLKVGLKLAIEIAPDGDLISQTKRLLADAYVGLGKYTQAQKTAEEALKVAEKINERVEIAACYRVFGLVASHSKDNDRAITWFNKAVDMYKLIQSRYELAATQYLLAVSGLYDSGVQSGLLHMAREYFVSEDIKHYIEKIDKELAAINSKKRDNKGIPAPDPNKAPVFITNNYKTRKIVEMAEHIAESTMTVLLTGETGAGKDQLARYIHYFSGRKGEIVPVNCAAIPDTMVESELFGHTKGAFTGAECDKPGILEDADGGTVYLNEIGDATAAFQAKLLEVLETRKVRKLGTNELKPLNVRFITATNYDLQDRIRNNQFRLDLYHRINEIPIHLPPLKERKEDIPDLARHFFEQANIKANSDDENRKFAEIGDHLKKRIWVGNVRELKSEVERLAYMSGGDLDIIINDLSNENRSEQDRLLMILEETDWNRSEAARRLGVSEGTIRNWIIKFNLGDQ